MDISRYHRGSIWWYTDTIVDKNSGERGILRGDRPIVIISSVPNESSTCTITYLPFTSATTAQEKSHTDEFFLVSVEMPKKYPSYIACNQIRAGVTNHFCGYIGSLSDDKMQEVEEMMLRYLDMEKYIKNAKKSSAPAVTLKPSNSVETVPASYFSSKHAVVVKEDNLVFVSSKAARDYYGWTGNGLASAMYRGTPYKGKMVESLKKLMTEDISEMEENETEEE